MKKELFSQNLTEELVNDDFNPWFSEQALETKKLQQKIFIFLFFGIKVVTIPENKNVRYADFVKYFTYRLQLFVGPKEFKENQITLEFYNQWNKALDLQAVIPKENIDDIICKVFLKNQSLPIPFMIEVQWASNWSIIKDKEIEDLSVEEKTLADVSFYLLQISKTGFDLNMEINPKNTWNDVWDKLKLFLIKNGILKIVLDKLKVTGQDNKTLNVKLGDEGINDSSASKKFLFYWEKKPLADVEICFKNIDVSSKTYHKIQTYLSKWTSGYRFNVQEKLNVNHTWADIVKLIREDMKMNGFEKEIIERIFFKLSSGSMEDKLKDGNYKLGENHKAIKFRYLPYSEKWSQDIIIHFKKIVSPEYTYDKIERYLKNSSNNPIDMEQNIGRYNTLFDLIFDLKNHILNSKANEIKDFSKLVFELVDLDGEKKIYNSQWNEKDGTVSITVKFIYYEYSEEFSQTMTLKFKNVTNEANYYQKINKFLSSFKDSNRFDVQNKDIDGDNTWADLMTIVKNRMHQKFVFPQEVNDKLEFNSPYYSFNVKIKVSLTNGLDDKNIRFRYLNHSDKWSDKIKLHFKNILPSRTFYSRIQSVLKSFSYKNKPLNLRYRLSGENNWNDVTNILKKEMENFTPSIPTSVISKVQFTSKHANRPLSERLLDCDEDKGTNFKNIVFKYPPFSDEWSYGDEIKVEKIAMDTDKIKFVKGQLEKLGVCSVSMIDRLFEIISS